MLMCPSLHPVSKPRHCGAARLLSLLAVLRLSQHLWTPAEALRCGAFDLGQMLVRSLLQSVSLLNGALV